MLVFSRKRNESIMIGPDIEITVVSVGKDGVRLGIRAPREIPIHRKEVFLSIEQENQAASLVSIEKLEQIRQAIRSSRLRKAGERTPPAEETPVD
jgi:carbon storage regulator